jgi:toxin YoeB
VRLVFSERAWEDTLYWQAKDPKLLSRLNGLIKECAHTPFSGTGKPEPLRRQLSGWGSRRLTQEHRLVYKPSVTGF